MRRRTLNLVLGLGLVAPFTGLLPTIARADEIDMAKVSAPRILGDPKAKVKITEYFSMTCPHCAHFHNTTLPQLKEAFIDTGKLQFELKDFPLDQWALRAAAMARGLEGKRYFAMVELLMKKQESWARANDPHGALVQLGKLAGLSESQVDAYMGNEKVLDFILNERLVASRDLKINATPSFMMDGRKLDNVFEFDSFKEVISDAL